MTQVLIDKDDAEVALTAIVAAYGASNKSATALRAALANAEPKPTMLSDILKDTL